MTAARDTQLSFVDGMERPVGSILLSVQTGTNADLMARIAPLYLSGSVLDVTYGEGKWWGRFTPEPFTFHDLHKIDGVDFRALPHSDQAFDTVCFDPPYVLSGGETTTSRGHEQIQGRYGIGHGLTGGLSALLGLVSAGLGECCRVARSFVLVKCMEFTASGFVDMPTYVINTAAENGWRLHDRIVHHAGTGPGGHNIFTVKRARRAHSYLLVFTPTTGQNIGREANQGDNR